MVHGIQGRPEQFRFLTETLPGDTLINCLLLPGHGAGVKQFRHSDQGIWLSAVIDAATDMRLKCDNIIFVGHSMGCLLGLIAEQNNPGLFSSMILLCCPFSIRLTFRYMKNNILSFQKEPTDPFVLATKEANSVSAKTPLAYISCKTNEASVCPCQILFCRSGRNCQPTICFYRQGKRGGYCPFVAKLRSPLFFCRSKKRNYRGFAERVYRNCQNGSVVNEQRNHFKCFSCVAQRRILYDNDRDNNVNRHCFIHAVISRRVECVVLMTRD